jgi:hypothetical protein
MKNLVKLFAAGLVILASNSFAQTNFANGQKITGNAHVGTATASKGGKTSEVSSYVDFPNTPSLNSTFKDERRELKARGMNNQEIRRTLKKDVREARLDRMQTQHLRQMHSVARTHSQMAQHRITARKAGR